MRFFEVQDNLINEANDIYIPNENEASNRIDQMFGKNIRELNNIKEFQNIYNSDSTNFISCDKLDLLEIELNKAIDKTIQNDNHCKYVNRKYAGAEDFIKKYN